MKDLQDRIDKKGDRTSLLVKDLFLLEIDNKTRIEKMKGLGIVKDKMEYYVLKKKMYTIAKKDILLGEIAAGVYRDD